MHRTLRLGVAALGLTLTLHASPATAEVEPVGDAKLVFKLYDAHATTMRRARYGRVVAFGILGSGAVVTAALGVPQDSFARSYLAIAGTSALLASLLNLGIPTSAEHTAREIRAGVCCTEPSALHARWVTEAKRARTTRFAYGITSAIFGLANATIGMVALTLDDPTLTEPDRSNLAAFGFAAGAVGLAGAAAFVLIPSPTERALAQFEAVPSTLHVASISLLPIPAGAAIVLGGAY